MKTQEKYRNILRKMPMNCIKQAEERNLLNLLTETRAAKSAYFLISSRKCIWKQICNKRTYFSTAEETSAKACLCTAENVRMILPQSLKLLLCLQQWSTASGRTWDLGETLPLPQKLAPEMWLWLRVTAPALSATGERMLANSSEPILAPQFSWRDRKAQPCLQALLKSLFKLKLAEGLTKW